MSMINTNVGSAGIKFNNNSSNSSVSAIDTQKEELNKTSTDYKNNVETETMDLEVENSPKVQDISMNKEEQVYTYETSPEYGSEADIALANVSNILNFMGVSEEKDLDIKEIRIGGPSQNIYTAKFGNNNTIEFNQETGKILKLDINDDTYSDLDIIGMTNEGLKESEKNATTFIYTTPPDFEIANEGLANCYPILPDSGTPTEMAFVNAALLLDETLNISYFDLSKIQEVVISGANENIYGIRYKDYDIRNDNYTTHFVVIDKDTGEIRRIESNGSVYTNYDGKGLTTNDPKAMDIFDESRDEVHQYGGDQEAFYDNRFELAENEDIRKILTENFPDATEEDYWLYLDKISYVGCGYVAMVNSIFDAYQGKQEEFENTFHIPMYRLSGSEVVFNYEPLVVSLYTHLWKDVHGYDNIEDIYGNIMDLRLNPNTMFVKGADGLNIPEMNKLIDILKDDYGVDCNIKSVIYNQLISDSKSLYEEQKDDFNSMIFLGLHYAFYSIDETTGERGELLGDNVGGHGMSITGITPNGDFIVSSWGKRFIMVPSNLSLDWVSLIDINV